MLTTFKLFFLDIIIAEKLLSCCDETYFNKEENNCIWFWLVAEHAIMLTASQDMWKKYRAKKKE